MVRTVKAPEVRRAELLDIAQSLFQKNGYVDTPVEDIVREANIAKGTFYHYFRTKEDVLAALATRLVENIAARFREIADDTKHRPIAKLKLMFTEAQRIGGSGKNVVQDLHRPANRELHDRNNVETIRVLGPIVAEVIEQGKAEGVFDVDDSLSTVQFIMAGSLFLFGEGVFSWTEQEKAARMRAMKVLIQRALHMNLPASDSTAQASGQKPRKRALSRSTRNRSSPGK